MQRTRLSTLFGQAAQTVSQWIFNPWRRLSVGIISLLFGNFFAVAISATAGQTAEIDIVIAGLLLLLAEFISWLFYRYSPRLRADRQPSPLRPRSYVIEMLNAFKLGMIYGLFVEAFKLGS